MTPPKVSVCMPMYNASRFLRECIDSVLAQTFTDFEFLIADDGSTDNSVEIVESYSDPRISLIRRPHDYIATLNSLLSEARGEYVARMDADDVMLPTRLQLQVDYMDANHDVDVLGGGMILFGNGQESQINCIENISMIEMIDSCAIAHPTVMLRRSTLDSYELFYSPDHPYAEDYELWIRMLKAGCILRNLTTPLIKYRQSEQQISSVHSQRQQELTHELKRDAIKWLIEKTYEVLDEPAEIPPSECQLTVVIPFLNEGDELINTVKSVRETAGNEVEIVVVNDCSTDKRNYQDELKPYGVRYYSNRIRIGAALSKERGVKLSPTPYFIILDAHMRCLTPNWHQILDEKLSQNPNRLLCCDTVPILKHIDGSISVNPSMVPCKAAFLTFKEDSLLPGIKWFAKPHNVISGLPPEAICAVLGACYCSSKYYWNKITGMQGLLHFGSEEACISLKAWLEGGGCYFAPEVVLGHIYRNQEAFYISREAFVYNHLAISKMLLPIADQCLVHSLAQRTNTASYDVASLYLQANQQYLTSIRARFKNLITERYGYIVDINANASWLHYTKTEEIENVLLSIHNKLLETEPKSGGLLDGGASGILLYLLAYNKLYTSVDGSKLMITSLFDYIYDVIKQGKCNYSMWNGYAGIGWGLLYMASNNLIDDNMEEVLCNIDRKISEWAPSNISDHSFLYGLGGVYCYVVNRISYCKKFNLSDGFNKFFLKSLEDVAPSLLKISDEYRSATYAMQYLKSSQSADFCFDVMRPMDIVKPIRFIPKNHKLWKLDYHNVLGFAFEMIYLNTKRLYYEKESL